MEKSNGLKFNVGKTEGMFIPKAGEIRGPQIVMRESRIDCRRSLKILGLCLGTTGLFIEHIKEIRQKLLKIINAM